MERALQVEQRKKEPAGAGFEGGKERGQVVRAAAGRLVGIRFGRAGSSYLATASSARYHANAAHEESEQLMENS